MANALSLLISRLVSMPSKNQPIKPIKSEQSFDGRRLQAIGERESFISPQMGSGAAESAVVKSENIRFRQLRFASVQNRLLKLAVKLI